MKNIETMSFPFELKQGRVVPGLEGVEWLNGSKVEIGNGLTLIECFKTDVYYDGEPPYMNEIPEKYRKKITCIAITSEEKKVVKKFLKEMGELVFYPVGICSPELYESYMKNVNRYPNAFLVNEEGRLLWQGNPFDLKDEPNLPSFIKLEYQKKVMDLADKRDKLFTLDLKGANGKIAENPYKDEIRAMAKECHEFFDYDEEIRIICCNYEHLLFGEDAPELGKIKWIQGKSELGGKLTVIIVLDLSNEYKPERYLYINKIYNDFGDKINFIGITSSSKEEVSEFLENHSEEIQYPIGIVSEKVFKSYLTEYTALSENGCFLINPEKKFLWSGYANEGYRILNGILNLEVTEEDLREFTSAREFFERIHINLLNSYRFNLEALEKLKKYSKTILKLIPNCIEVITFLMRTAVNVDYEEYRKICKEIDTSSFDTTDYKNLLEESNKFGEGKFPYEQAPEWMHKMIALEPKSTENLLFCSFYLEEMHLTEAALKLIHKAIELAPGLKAQEKKNIERLEKIKEGK